MSRTPTARKVTRGGRPRKISRLQARQNVFTPESPDLGATHRPGSNNPRKSWPRI